MLILHDEKCLDLYNFSAKNDSYFAYSAFENMSSLFNSIAIFEQPGSGLATAVFITIQDMREMLV